MGADALLGWLEAAGVPAGSVSVQAEDGAENDAEVEHTWCLRRVEQGWEVFWAEGGERYEWTRFDDEAVACFALFGRLVWTRVARGALVPRR